MTSSLHVGVDDGAVTVSELTEDSLASTGSCFLLERCVVFDIQDIFESGKILAGNNF